MSKKTQIIGLFLVLLGGMGLSSVSFSGDEETADFLYWQRRVIESKDSKDGVLLEMLGVAAKEEDGFTFRILQIHGPHLFCGDVTNNKRDFQKLLLDTFKTRDLHELRSVYGIEEGESDLSIARVFQIVFYLYAVERGFIYQLRERVREAVAWEWRDSGVRELISSLLMNMDEFLGADVVFHIRARIKNVQRVEGTEKAAVVIEWELLEIESTYNVQKDEVETTERVIETRGPQIELLDKGEAEGVQGACYGTKRGLSLERETVISIFEEFIKANPLPHKIGVSNWERLISPIPPLSEGMNFVLIPAGMFKMGSPSTESDRFDNEILHKVTLTKSFEMMTTEVTQKQWMDVMGNDPSHFKGEDLPVESVSCDEVQLFIQKLNERKDGYTYRLPTEAEWEYAARGGSTTASSFGDNVALLKEHGWHNENSQNTTHPVASCPTKERARPNGFGLYDTHGNVWEWVSDWYGDYPISGIVTDPVGPVTGSNRVIRGGSWHRNARNCRSALRAAVLKSAIVKGIS